MLHWPDIVTRQFAANLFVQMPDFLADGTVAELQIVIRHEVLDLLNFERHAHADTDRTHRKELDHAFDAHRTIRTQALKRRHAHHLRPIKHRLTRTAFAGIHHELRDRLPE